MESRISEEDRLIQALREGSQVILQRHAQSESNARFIPILRKYGCESKIPKEEYLKCSFIKEDRDTRISELGIEQCLKSQKVANQLDIHTVIVSPMRRAMMTAYYVYKDHPNFENIKFIMLPCLRECINHMGDCPVHIDDIMEEFKPIIPQLDDSEINKKESRAHWFMDDFTFSNKNEEFQEKLKSDLKDDCEDSLNTNLCELLMDCIRELMPKPLECGWKMRERSTELKKFVKSYISKNKISKDQKVILVGHYKIFSYYTGKWESELSREEKLPSPTDYVKLENCQFASDTNDFKEITLEDQ
ncbi:unnamed protein product [Moneuplotes crassus]|uniref:Uncharacterized protein n=1 Tax=Euplotes crassus TaxID=5936 RepID=A0AAD1UPL7_EUPCR|nr:unnamed protein product [Moneuplotes crassus]